MYILLAESFSLVAFAWLQRRSAVNANLHFHGLLPDGVFGDEGPVAVLLRTEDDRLNAAGLNAKMPEGW